MKVITQRSNRATIKKTYEKAIKKIKISSPLIKAFEVHPDKQYSYYIYIEPTGSVRYAWETVGKDIEFAIVKLIPSSTRKDIRSLKNILISSSTKKNFSLVSDKEDQE